MDATEKREPAGPIPKTLRIDFGLSLPIFARTTGTPETPLARWEGGAEQLDAPALARLERVEPILHGLARVMRLPFIPVWLEQPNDACKEIGVRTPLDLMERGDYAEVEGLLFYLESGTPG